jgi:hypothetical protein
MRRETSKRRISEKRRRTAVLAGIPVFKRAFRRNNGKKRQEEETQKQDTKEKAETLWIREVVEVKTEVQKTIPAAVG